ncbi:MAG: CbtA family protein [Rhodobacteraceae bacterium]|nr:CbtA family protein [Paracoccaceae bacterium]
MINRMLPSALFAGFAAGLIAALLQFVFVEKLILLAEDYESGTRVHFAGVMQMDGHSHDHAAMATDAGTLAAESTTEPAAEGHQHHHEEGEEASPLKRHVLTVLFAILTYTGFALVLVAGFALAGMVAHRPDLKAGLLWGLAGFATFQLAPAIGLEPELPGTMAAALESRQIWWAGTAIATAAGLALLAFGWGLAPRGGALALLVLPHVIGAPELDGFSGITPPELASQFAARTLAVGLMAWLVLGAVAARLWTGQKA